MALLLPVLAGCGALTPFETAPPPAAAGEKGTPVSVCYNGLASTSEQVRSTALEQCSGGTLGPVRTEWDFSHCPVLVPQRATFTCGTP